MPVKIAERLGMLVGAAAVFILYVFAAPAEAIEIEPVVTYIHTSDIARGRPFNDKSPNSQDYLGAGVTLRLGRNKRIELDLTHGVKTLRRGSLESGTAIAVRWYPRRGR